MNRETKTVQEALCVYVCVDCLFFSVCYQPSSALVQAQPLDRSLII